MAERTQLGETGPEVKSYDVDMVVKATHEIGWPLEDSTWEETVVVPPNAAETVVLFQSNVRATAARSFCSPAYLATVRRREARAIAGLVEKLGDYATSDDFIFWTHEPLERLRRIISTLSESEVSSYPKHEGNATEIFRQLRDSFLGSGWNRYSEPSVREFVRSVLMELAVADEVSADDAFRVGDQLLELDIDPAVGVLYGDGAADGQEDAEVPD